MFKHARLSVMKTNSMFDEGVQRIWMTRDLAKRLGLRPKGRELLITSGLANSKSKPEFYEVTEFTVQANDGIEIAIRAIVIDYLIDPLEDKYRERLLELNH